MYLYDYMDIQVYNNYKDDAMSHESWLQTVTRRTEHYAHFAGYIILSTFLPSAHSDNLKVIKNLCRFGNRFWSLL